MTLRKNKPDNLDGQYCEIVRHIFYMRYATLEQVDTAWRNKPDLVYTGRYLKRLEEWGYLKYRQHPYTHRKAYFLGVVGRHWIVKQGLASSNKEAEKLAGTKGAFDDLSHDLQVSKIYSSLLHQSRGYGLSFDWKNENQLTRENLGIRPDAWVSVGSSKASVSAFVEFTDWLPDEKEMQGKLDRYVNLFGKQGVSKILWVTTTKNKQNFLQKHVDFWRYRDKVFLGLIEDINKGVIGKVWTWCGKQIAWITVAGAD